MSFFQIFQIFIIPLLDSGAWFWSNIGGRSGGEDLTMRVRTEKHHLVVLKLRFL
jgi:hypothetical protein